MRKKINRFLLISGFLTVGFMAYGWKGLFWAGIILFFLLITSNVDEIAKKLAELTKEQESK